MEIDTARLDEVIPGTVNGVVLARPIVATVFIPQHTTIPSARIAQVCDAPAAIETAGLAEDIPETVTGLLRCVVVPSPSWALPFSPQHLIAPSARIAQVCDAPAAIETAGLAEDIPETVTGLLRCVVVPSPSWPMLFAPQHLIVPLVTIAQVCEDPVAITP
jgi:hypothetical protein